MDGKNIPIIDILIPIEISSRELLHRVYLCHLLALKGFKCYLGNKAFINNLMEKMQGYIYFDKGYHKGQSEKIYGIVKKNKGIIINLDEEGAVDFSNNITLLSRYARPLFLSADIVFLWGRRQYNLVEDNISDKGRVFISGHPRFELLKKQYHVLYQDKVANIKSQYGDFILINTNMGYGNNILGDEYILTGYRDRYPNIQLRIDFDKKKFDTILSLVKTISEKTNKTIIIRPHPEENTMTYLNKLSDYKNIHVIYKGSVIPWLFAAEVMIHPDCTTGIESLLIGKKSISFLPKDYASDLVTKLPLDASYKFTDQEKLMNFLSNKSYIEEEDALKEIKFVEECFSFSQDACQFISDKIYQLYNSNNSNKTKELLFIDRLSLIYRSVRSKLDNYKANQRGLNKLKGFNYSKIKIVKSQCNRFNSDFEKVKLIKIYDRLYVFQI